MNPFHDMLDGRRPPSAPAARRSPLVKPGPRPLRGVEEFDFLKKHARITALAAASTFTVAGKFPHSSRIPPAESCLVRRSAAALPKPRSMLLSRPPPKYQRRRRGHNWELAVLGEATYCFEDAAESDRLSGWRAPSPTARVRELRKSLAEAESLLGSSSAQLAPLLCHLACAILSDAAAERSSATEGSAPLSDAAADEAEALGTRAASLSGAQTRPGRSSALSAVFDPSAALNGLAELSFMLEARGAHPAAVRVQRWRLAAAHGTLEVDSLNRAAAACDLAQSLLRSASRPDPLLTKKLEMKRRSPATTSAPADAASPPSSPSSNAHASVPASRSRSPLGSSPPQSGSPSSSVRARGASAGARWLDIEFGDSLEETLPPRSAQLHTPPSSSSPGLHMWQDVDQAATLIQGRIRRRVALRGAWTFWTKLTAAMHALHERTRVRLERAAAMQLARDAQLSDALSTLAEAESVLNRYDARGEEPADDEPGDAEMPGGIRAVGRHVKSASERSRSDGVHATTTLRMRILLARAEALEGVGSLDEAIDVLNELCRLQALANVPAIECVPTLAKLIDLIRRARPRREAAWPLQRLLAAERQLARPLEDGLFEGDLAGFDADLHGRRRTVAEAVAAELLELYQDEGMFEESMRLMFSEASPVPRVERIALESVVRNLQTAFRMRQASATLIAAGERGRRGRSIGRKLRRRVYAATRAQKHVRDWFTRRRLAHEANLRRWHSAATVMQACQRARIESKKLKWRHVLG